MSKCTVSPPFRTESSSLVIYPCRLWEPFVSSELGICGCQGQEADFELISWTLFSTPNLFAVMFWGASWVYLQSVLLWHVWMLPVFFFYIIMLPMLVSAQVTCESCGFTGILLSFFSVSFDELINSSGNSSHFASNASCRVLVSSRSTLILASCKMIPFLLSSESMV